MASEREQNNSRNPVNEQVQEVEHNTRTKRNGKRISRTNIEHFLIL